MSAPHLQHLAALIANDGHAASFQILGQDRTALLKEIAQASAAPEQEPAAWGLAYKGRVIAAHMGRYDLANTIDYSWEGLHTHADPSEVERLRAENKELTLKLAQSDHNYDCDRDQFRDNLEVATQRADAAERKLGEAVGLLRELKSEYWHTNVEMPAALLNRIDALLSASAEPAECQHRYMYFGSQPARRCADCNKVEPAKGGDGEVQS